MICVTCQDQSRFPLRPQRNSNSRKTPCATEACPPRR
jgi:hypothetical protein